MNRNIFHIFSVSVLLTAALCSCNKDDMEAYSEFDLKLTAKVEEGSGASLTKAELLGSGSAIPGNTFKLYGWEGDKYWIKGEDATYASSKWSLSRNYRMNSSRNYSYLAYANLPSSGAEITAPSTKDGDLTFAVTDIASAQNDVLLGRYSVSNPETGDVDIDFSHPFASVKFRLGNAVDEGTTVSAISLDGLYTSGKTTFGQSSTADGDGVMQYTWTNLGNANATLSTTGLSKAEGEDIVSFVVIPQDLSSKHAVMTITYNDGNKMTKLLSDDTWTAGYTITYTLDKIGTIDVDFSGDAIVINSGSSKIYVRTTITGAWYDSSDNIVAPWSVTDGSFTDFPGSGWSQSGDFYYYASALSNSATATLYSSYTPEEAPIEGATLKLDILVQAIPYDVNKTCQEAFAAL